MEGFVPVTYDKLGGMIPDIPDEKVPDGFTILAKNVRLRGGAVFPRGGLVRKFQTPNQSERITGLGQTELQNNERRNLIFTSAGQLFEESPTDSLALALTANTPALPANAYAEMTSAYGRMYMAFSDLRVPLGAPLQYIKSNYNGLFYVDPIGLDPNPTPASGAVVEDTGIVDVGTRHFVVLPITRTGYIGGATKDAILTAALSTANKKVRVNGIPVFSETNVVGRAIAVTLANGSTDGPWFLIELDDEVDGVAITKTIIDDNTTTTALFNFSDEYLAGKTDITEEIFGVEKLANQTSVYYNKTLKRLMAWGDNSSIIRMSDPDKPEVFKSLKGFVQIGPNDDQHVVAVREFKTETVFLKNNSGYIPLDSSLDPTAWNVPRRWNGSGPVGPRAVDVTTEFLTYSSRDGQYVYLGDLPFNISMFMQPLWDKINWDYGHLVWCRINHIDKIIHVGVPFESSTLPNLVFNFDYTQGWRKILFSYDEISAHDAVWLLRNAPGLPAATYTNKTELFFATSVPDGSIHVLDPNRFDDNGQGIDEKVQVPFASASQSSGIIRFGGFDVSARGAGALTVRRVRRNGNVTLAPEPLVYSRPINLGNAAGNFHRGGDGRTCEKVSLVFSNGAVAGSWFELHHVTIWINGAFEHSL